MRHHEYDQHLESIKSCVDAGNQWSDIARELGLETDKLRCYANRRGLYTRGPEQRQTYRALDVNVRETEIPVFERDYRHLDKLHLYPLGDVHKGAASHQQDTWREWLAYLTATRHASMLGTGDFFNAALKDSKSEAYDEVMTVGKARKELTTEMRELADEGRLDGLGDGNHEDRIYRATGDSPVDVICDVLGVPYVRASALFVYHVGDQTYEVFYRHGTGNGQSAVALTKGSSIMPTADVHVTGHTHKQIVLPEDYFIREGDRVVRRHRYCVSSGSFLGLEEYAAVRGYTPTRIGAPRVRLDGKAHDIHVSV